MCPWVEKLRFCRYEMACHVVYTRLSHLACRAGLIY